MTDPQTAPTVDENFVRLVEMAKPRLINPRLTRFWTAVVIAVIVALVASAAFTAFTSRALANLLVILALGLYVAQFKACDVEKSMCEYDFYPGEKPTLSLFSWKR